MPGWLFPDNYKQPDSEDEPNVDGKMPIVLGSVAVLIGALLIHPGLFLIILGLLWIAHGVEKNVRVDSKELAEQMMKEIFQAKKDHKEDNDEGV